MKNTFILILLILFLQGCAHVAVTSAKYGESSYSATKARNIGIFHNTPSESYTKIGEIYVNASFMAKWPALYNQIKQEAASMGADAVIIDEGNPRKANPVHGRVINAIAIKFNKKEQVK